jgi:hypothetical protein
VILQVKLNQIPQAQDRGFQGHPHRLRQRANPVSLQLPPSHLEQRVRLGLLRLSVMLDDDAFAWFAAHGGLTRANGQRFRDMILSRGHTEDYGPMFRAFYGKAPDIGPMLEHRGLSLKSALRRRRTLSC